MCELLNPSEYVANWLLTLKNHLVVAEDLFGSGHCVAGFENLTRARNAILRLRRVEEFPSEWVREFHDLCFRVTCLDAAVGRAFNKPVGV